MHMKSMLISFLLAVGFWLALNGSVDSNVLIAGIVISIITVVFVAKRGIFDDLKLGFRALVALIALFFVFSVELVKSNIDVALRVISPTVKINPAIVEVNTRLKSRLGRLALANLITLTPGTLTIDIIDDKLYIHWIDASALDSSGATKAIVEKFEKYLEVIFG
jgi:multicomponent Na+:H+ antiporter subunit E